MGNRQPENDFDQDSIEGTGDLSSEPHRIPLGAHLMVHRRHGYAHHGIYIGSGQVVHFSGEPTSLLDKFAGAQITIASLEEFRGPDELKWIEHEDVPYSPEEVVERAHSRVGESGYGLFKNNCEHFANWCCTGNETSGQVKYWVLGGMVAVYWKNKSTGRRVGS